MQANPQIRRKGENHFYAFVVQWLVYQPSKLRMPVRFRSSAFNGVQSRGRRHRTLTPVEHKPTVGSNPTTPILFRDVAQFGRPSGLGPESRRFKSCHPDLILLLYLYAGVSEWHRRMTQNHLLNKRVGSSPITGILVLSSSLVQDVRFSFSKHRFKSGQDHLQGGGIFW